MALETGSHIDDLVAANPTFDDPKSQGDDHLRLIKSVLKTSFPDVNVPVNLANIPATTKMLFVQSAVPSGWTLDESFDDRILRIDAVAGGTTGGSWTITGLGTPSQTSTAESGAAGPYASDAHSHTGDGTWRPLYVDAVIGTRD